MEATATVPVKPGTAQGDKAADGHVHQLLALAGSLTRTATGRAAAHEAAGAAGHAAADVVCAASIPDASTPDAAGFAAAQPPVSPGSVSGGGRPGLLGTPLGVDLGALTDAELVVWAQDVEQLGRYVHAVQVHAASELAARVRAGRFESSGVKTPADLFATTLKISRAEAGRRTRLAGHFLPATDPLTLVVTEAAHPVLGSAFFAGDLSADQALTVARFAEEAAHLAEAGRIDPATAAELEESLTGHARDLDPDSLARLGVRAVNLLDPDGQQPSDGELIARQGIFFRHPRRGLVHFDGHMTVPQYETLMSSIGWATNPSDHKDINTIDPHTNADHGAGNGTGADGQGGNGGADRGGGAEGGSGSASDGGAMPGQTELLDFLRTAATGAGTAQAPPATSWPPNQGPAPDRALLTTKQPVPGPATHPVPEPAAENTGVSWIFPDSPGEAGIGWAPRQETGTDADWRASLPGSGDPQVPGPGIPLPGTTTSSTAAGADADADADAGGSADASGPVPWPHLVNGISVPEPGSEQDLAGLDPIDPDCTDPVVQDRRTHGQKLLDGLIDSLKLAARTNKLPLNGGLKPQLFISTTQDDLERRTTAGKPGGIAFLPYSGPQPLALFEEELCDADVTTMILGNGHDILNVGRTQRLFTLAQRKILLARDMGCTFPDCTAPAYWCEAHHITPWQDGGNTNIDNGCLTCGLHHHIVHRGQWSIKLDNGVPWYTPAYSIDPTQRPCRNTYHHGLPKT